MIKNDPISEKINAKQAEINKDNRLLRKKRRVNYFSLITSFLLFVTVLIALVRTLLMVMK